MSLKPPWKQKTPIMEKACQVYHKQTAPSKAVEVLDKMKVKSEAEVKIEVLGSYSSWWNKEIKQTLFTAKLRGYPLLIGTVMTKGDSLDRIRMYKVLYGPKAEVILKGKTIIRFAPETIRAESWSL